MEAIFNNEILVVAFGSEELEKMSELLTFVAENAGCPNQLITDKADELGLAYAEDNYTIVGNRPPSSSH